MDKKEQMQMWKDRVIEIELDIKKQKERIKAMKGELDEVLDQIKDFEDAKAGGPSLDEFKQDGVLNQTEPTIMPAPAEQKKGGRK